MNRIGIGIAALFGAATAIYLVFFVGLASVFAAIAALGWSGFALYCGLGVAMFAVLSTAWFVLVPHNRLQRWPTFFWGRAVRDSAAEVLPLSQLGGYVIGARAVALHGVSAAEAYASTVVDITTEMLAQIVFIAVGAVLFVMHFGLHSRHSHLFVPLVLGTLLAAAGAAGFIVVQRRGPTVTEKLAARLLPQAVRYAGAFARAIGAIYASPVRIACSVAIHFCGWMSSAFANWVALHLIGVHISFASMVAIESALSGIRSAAFIVPSAMGVQEATYVMLMPLFGVGPEIGLALSLIRRARDVALGIPVLLAWQGLEGRHALALNARDERLSEN